MNISEVIKSRRQKRNMTQAELAALLNVTPQAVSRWEMNISYPDVVMLPKIAQALQVSADELLGIEPLENRESGQDKERESGCGRERGTDPNREQEMYPNDQFLNQSQADSIFDYVPVPVTGQSKRVLIVDDADFLRMTLEDILSYRGHTVLQAGNGQECLDILQKENVDVCLLDIVMPVMDGMETLRRIREEKPDLRVIMLSALSRESMVRLALQRGADAFVVKPFNEACLLERL